MFLCLLLLFRSFYTIYRYYKIYRCDKKFVKTKDLCSWTVEALFTKLKNKKVIKSDVCLFNTFI